LRVADPREFIKKCRNKRAFSNEDIDEQLKRAIVTEFSDAIGEMKIPALDLAAQYKEMAERFEKNQRRFRVTVWK
jgi:membrane protease subunit (stomatin/prohibitin family)